MCVCVGVGWGGALSCLTLCDPMDCSLPGSFVHGTFQARTLEWISIFFSRGSSLTRDWNRVSCVSSIGRGILYHYAACEATYSTLQTNKYDWDRLCPEYTCLLRSTYLEAIQGMRKHQRQWILHCQVLVTEGCCHVACPFAEGPGTSRRGTERCPAGDMTCAFPKGGLRG